MKTKYLCADGLLEISDAELQIDLHCAFTPLTLDAALPKGLRAKEWQHDGYLYARGIVDQREVLCGEYVLLYDDGKARSRSYYTDNQLHGPSYFFDREGILLSESWWWQGLRQGKTHWYYSQEALASRQRFKDGAWHLLQEFFYEDGQVKSLLNYRHGKLHGETHLYNPDGSLARYYFYDNGQLKEMTIH